VREAPAIRSPAATADASDTGRSGFTRSDVEAVSTASALIHTSFSEIGVP